MFTRSPKTISLPSEFKTLSDLSTLSLSPVRELSLTSKPAASITLPSADATAPASKISMSPFTTSRAGISQTFPSLITFAWGADIFFSAARDFSALKCSTVPIILFITITRRITAALSPLPVSIETAEHTSRIITSKSSNWEKKTSNTFFFFSSLISFGPFFKSLSLAFSCVRPFSLVRKFSRTAPDVISKNLI